MFLLQCLLLYGEFFMYVYTWIDHKINDKKIS